MIRSVALQTYEEAAHAVGVDPFRQMSELGLAFERPLPGDIFVPQSAFVQLLERTARASSCPDFGLRMGQWRDEFFEGPLVLLMRHADTLHDALALAQRYGYAYSAGFQPTLVPAPDHPGMVDLIVASRDADSTRSIQASEYTVSTLLRVLRHVQGRTNGEWAVLLPHRMALAHEQYQKYFDCAIRFEMPFAAIRIARCDLDQPLPQRNPLRADMAISYIEARFKRADESLCERVKELLRERLGMRQVRQRDIAAELSMHEKTLQRRLAKEGRDFPGLLDDVRRDAFTHWLAHPAQPGLAHIAQMLGYSEQAALSRSCRRWFGCSPSELQRRRHLRHFA